MENKDETQKMNIPTQKSEAVGASGGGAGVEGVTSGPAKMQMTSGMTGYEQDKKARRMLAGMIVLAVVAVAGLATAGLAFALRGQDVAKLEEQVAELTDEDEVTEVELKDETTGEVVVKTVKVVDNDLAQNLINPYLVSFGYLGDVFDEKDGLTENAKFYIAFMNLDDNMIYYYDSTTAVVNYTAVNEEYKYLFGSAGNLAKTNYLGGYRSFTYSEEGGWGKFDVIISGGGGAGLNLISVVKDAYYDGDNVVVEVYHDVTIACDMEGTDDYCLEGNSVSYHTPDAAVKAFIEKFGERIPVYKMTFGVDDGHYVLKNIAK